MTDPVARLKAALADYTTAQTETDHAREVLHTAIVDALAAGIRQADIVRITGYTRERIRQINLEHT